MPNVRLIALVAAVFSALGTAAVPPVERLEGESGIEDGPEYYDPNYYLSDENPFAPSSEGDADMGEQVILRRQPKRGPVEVRADSSLFWSSNVGSVAVGEDDGWYFGGSLSARWKQRLNEHFYFDTYAYQDAYFYDSDGLDFQSSEFGAGLIADVPFIDGLTVYGRYEFLYVHSDNPLVGALAAGDDLHSRYHRLRFGAYKALFAKPGHLVSLATHTSWDFDANSGTQRRLQYSGRLAYTWEATARLRATGYYRLSYRDYLASSRQDWNQYAGVELNYTLTDWAEAHASVLYGANDSNGGGGSRDYEAFQAGLGLGLRASF